jgi:hypothetical protein
VARAKAESALTQLSMAVTRISLPHLRLPSSSSER